MKNLCMIACISKDGGLGKNNQLIWHIPEDMKFFRAQTMDHTVVMGGNNFRSIGQPLPKRENVVLSRSEPSAQDVKWFNNERDLVRYLGESNEQKFIIGGASLYEHFLPEAERLYLTEVGASRPADSYFPKFNREQYTRKVLQTGEYEGIKYEMVEYTRKETNE